MMLTAGCTQALGPMLQSAGFPAQFVVDQGRAGQQNLRQQWGDWCNIKGAGFGTRPTTSTGNPLIDAIIWVKPGGESDGTSNSSSPRYDSTCSLVRFALFANASVCAYYYVAVRCDNPRARGWYLVPGILRDPRVEGQPAAVRDRGMVCAVFALYCTWSKI